MVRHANQAAGNRSRSAGVFAAGLLVASLLAGNNAHAQHDKRGATPAVTDAARSSGQLTERALKQLLRWAARLSRLPLPEDPELPRLVSLSPESLSRRVCPHSPGHCGSLVAAYRVTDGVILYRDTFDFHSALDRSYIVHELVHFLQHINTGDRLNENCDIIRDNERQAYIAQSRYLSRRGESFPIDEMMKLTYCPNPTPGTAINAS